MICWKCKKEINVTEIYRTTECPECSAQLHVCKGCKFYSPGSHYDCRETVDDIITDKERSNFCDSFSCARDSDLSTSAEKSDASKAAFNALFGE